MDTEKKDAVLQSQYKLHREKRSNKWKLQTLDFEGNVLRISLQTSSTIEQNREKLTSLLYNAQGSKFNFRCILGLLAVLDHLECATVVKFQEAFEIYSSFFDHEPDSCVFRDKLLDVDVGLLCCYFLNPSDKLTYITLRTAEVPVELVIRMFQKSQYNTSDLHINPETLEKIIHSMDTEYDKQCIKAQLSHSNI